MTVLWPKNVTIQILQILYCFISTLAGQKYIKQNINGWKIYHLTSQMGDVIDMETELTSRLANLQKKLERERWTKPSHLNNIMVKVYKQTTDTNRTIFGSHGKPIS